MMNCGCMCCPKCLTARPTWLSPLQESSCVPWWILLRQEYLQSCCLQDVHLQRTCLKAFWQDLWSPMQPVPGARWTDGMRVMTCVQMRWIRVRFSSQLNVPEHRCTSLP